MNFTAKQLNQYETVAELLAAARREQGQELEKAEKVLKISKKYLLALEQGDYHLLPGNLYAKNFIRAYAQYLNLDLKKIDELTDRELAIAEQINRPTTAKTKDYHQSRILITPRTVKKIVVILLAVTCLGYLGWQVKTIFSPPPLTLFSPAAELITQNNEISIQGQTLPEAQVTINDQGILADRDGNFNKTLDLPDGLNTITVKAKKKYSREQTVIRQVLVQKVEIIENPEENHNNEFNSF